MKNPKIGSSLYKIILHDEDIFNVMKKIESQMYVIEEILKNGTRIHMYLVWL